MENILALVKNDKLVNIIVVDDKTGFTFLKNLFKQNDQIINVTNTTPKPRVGWLFNGKTFEPKSKK